MSEQLYECKNERCTMGSRDAPGHFTGGISQEQALMLTGNPDAPYGDGVCPNCGEPGAKAGKHVSVVGSDPHEAAHAEVAALVESGKLAPEAAQEKLLEMVGGGGVSDAGA